MGLSSIAVQQREKEAKSLKSFLAFSLIGSLALHVALLASGIFSLLSRTPNLAEEPLEVVIVEPPKVEEVKPKPEPKPQQTQPSKAVVSPGSSRIGGQPAAKAPVRTAPQPQPRTAPSPAVVAEKPPAPKPEPRQELAESLKPVPAPPPKPVQTPPPAPAPSPAVTNAPALPSARSTQRSPSIATGSGNSNAVGSGNNASGTRQGSSGSGSTVATGTGTARQGTLRGRGRGEGDSEGSGSGRLACSRCSQPRYPASAKRRGVEGTTKVRVNVDTGGNVTNVQIAKSSGNSDLDEAALKAVKRWKFQDLNRPRQGVVSVSFVLEGSERAQRAEERQKPREARKKRQPETANERKAPVAGNSSPSRNEAAAPRQQQPQSSTPPQQEAPSDRSRLMDTLRR